MTRGARFYVAMAFGRANRSRRLALALATDRIVAVDPRRTWRGLAAGAVRERPLECAADGEGGWSDLETALAELDAEGATVDVALLRPLAHAKALELPPVRRRDRHALLLRNARRYFAIGDAAVVADALAPASRLRPGAPARVVAVCAPESIASAIATAAGRAGLGVGGIVPAPVALAAAVAGRVRSARRGRVALVACDDGWTEVIVLERGLPRLFQPLHPPAGAEPGGLEAEVARALRLAADSGLAADRVLVCGAGDPAARLRTALARCGGGDADGAPVAADGGAARAGGGGESAEGVEGAPRLITAPGIQELPATVLAALGVRVLAELPLLRPPALRLEWRRRVRRRVALHAAAATALLVAAAAVHLRGMRAELEAAEAARGRLAPAVVEARAVRRSLRTVEELLDTVARFEAAVPEWPEVFASIATALPDSAYLRSIEADTGEIRLSGLAGSAAAAAAALAAAPGLGGIGFAGAARRDDASGRESFDLVAELMPFRTRPPARAPAGTPAGKPGGTPGGMARAPAGAPAGAPGGGPAGAAAGAPAGAARGVPR